MLIATIAGRLGKDAEHKTVGSSDLCSFSVAADVGYGDKKQTIWVDVSKWGKGASGLAGILKKGSAVTVIGELSTREYEGKTYLQCRADNVAIQGTPGGAQGGNSGSQNTSGGGWSQGRDTGGGGGSYGASDFQDDLDDEVPF
ncbi:MAG: single-stranded DNA-binding protein [Sphingorhabdus sp.]|nr:single-stranded DNA-binding protein [Sphingorhabdus sp.]|tara:strand:- start:901 stop:1329 length:429 start_codon:yes stop_codon:yes gene_type:complete